MNVRKLGAYCLWATQSYICCHLSHV